VSAYARKHVERDGEQWHSTGGLYSLVCVMMREMADMKTQIKRLSDSLEQATLATTAATGAEIPDLNLPLSSEAGYLQFVADVADDHILKRNVVSLLLAKVTFRNSTSLRCNNNI
jgi:hypothetical protein